MARSWMRPVRSVSAGPPWGGIVLEAAVLRGVVGRRDDDAVRRGGRLAVPAQDGVGNAGGGGVAVAGLHHGDHAVGGKHFKGGAPCGFGKGVGVFAEEERAGDAFGLAHVAHGLRDGKDVGLVEAGLQGGAAMAGRAEAHGLIGDVHGRFIRVVGGDESRDVGKLVGGRQFACLGMKSHGSLRWAWMCIGQLADMLRQKAALVKKRIRGYPRHKRLSHQLRGCSRDQMRMRLSRSRASGSRERRAAWKAGLWSMCRRWQSSCQIT